MRTHPLALLLATWILASPTHVSVHAVPNALALTQPFLTGPSLHLDRRQEEHHSHNEDDDDEDEAAQVTTRTRRYRAGEDADVDASMDTDYVGGFRPRPFMHIDRGGIGFGSGGGLSSARIVILRMF